MTDDLVKQVWRIFALARGPLSAFALVAILDEAFGWKRVSFLEFTHTLVVHWNHYLGLLFEPVFQVLPEFMKLGHAGTNLLLFLLAWFPLIVREVIYVRDLYGSWTLTLVIFFVVNMAILPWFAEPVFLKFGSSPWLHIMMIGIVSSIMALVVGSLVRPDREFERLYAHSMVFGFLFILTLELLHYMPQLEEAADRFVENANRLEERND